MEPWGGVKRSNIIYFQYHGFISNLVCVLTNEGYKTYQTGFSFCRLGHAPGVGTLAAGGAHAGGLFFFQKLSCGMSNRRGEQIANKIVILGSNW